MACVPVANRPLVVHGIETLIEAGASQVAIVVDPICAPIVRSAARAAEANGRLTWIEHGPESGLAGLVSEIGAFAGDDPLMIHLGDSLVRSPLNTCVGAFAGGVNDSLELLRSVGGDSKRVAPLFGRELDTNGHNGTGADRAGIYLVGTGFVEAAAEARPDGALEPSILQVIGEMANRGGRHSARALAASWRYHRNPKWILEANRFVLQSLANRKLAAETTESVVQGPVDIHPTAVLETSVVRGPAVIGAGTRLKDAYVGPYCSIGDRVRIEGSEIENSVIFDGASICHLGDRLEASVIGAGARVFREFRLPRGLRLDVGGLAEVCLS